MVGSESASEAEIEILPPSNAEALSLSGGQTLGRELPLRTLSNARTLPGQWIESLSGNRTYAAGVELSEDDTFGMLLAKR